MQTNAAQLPISTRVEKKRISWIHEGYRNEKLQAWRTYCTGRSGVRLYRRPLIAHDVVHTPVQIIPFLEFFSTPL